ncbi:MAG: arginase family protein [Deltaproteobacteria bacterium]|nr:arginase family protein [Deltaproteobacteria bacterium]
MNGQDERQVAFLGFPLDPDERQESLDHKLALDGQGAGEDDPYQEVMELIRQEVDPARWREEGSLEVPAWLRPMPPAEEREKLLVDNFVEFIDGEGCRAAAEEAGRHVAEHILPDIPCLLAVDHCLTGGVLAELARVHSPENISLVVLDSHLDAVPVPVTAGAILFDAEHNPSSVYDADNPFLHHRPDSYNASSFLHHLLDQGVVLPRNLIVAGLSDYPPKRAFKIKDQRIKDYAGVYSGLKARGAAILTKKDLAAGTSRFKALLARINTPFVYISIDMDVGAKNALIGVRFDQYVGLSEPQIYRLAEALRGLLDRGVRLAGLDLTEFNPRWAGGSDPTYRIAANLIRLILFGMEPAAA